MLSSIFQIIKEQTLGYRVIVLYSRLVYLCPYNNGPSAGYSTFQPAATSRVLSRTSDKNSCQEHQHAAEDDLEDRRRQWRIHVVVTDVRNDNQLHNHYSDGNGRGNLEVWDQIGQR